MVAAGRAKRASASRQCVSMVVPSNVPAHAQLNRFYLDSILAWYHVRYVAYQALLPISCVQH